MRVLTAIFFLLLGFCGYSQNDTLSKKRVDAEEFARMAIGIAEDSLSMLLKGAKHEKGKYGITDIYYIYSKREKKNIPLEFWYQGDEEKSRVWKVKFISRGTDYYKTSDLQTAFWIEWIRNP